LNAENNIEAALAAGMVMGDPKILGEHLAIVMRPAGAALEKIDLEQFAEQPRRVKGHTSLGDADSFARFVNRYKLAGLTCIYVNKDKTSLRAVFNDHGEPPTGTAYLGAANGASDEERALLAAGDLVIGASPHWRDHTADYACKRSKEWDIWTGAHGKQMNQTQFAQFIEDNLLDITNPESALMLEVANNFEAKKDVNFGSAIRLDNGSVNFRYKEDVQGTTRDGQMPVPREFDIAIPVFENGPRYAIKANLRYRVDSAGKLALWFELVRHDKSLDHAFKETVDDIFYAINAHMKATATDEAPGDREEARVIAVPYTVPFFNVV
jgi:uncharacterized protein YfdQ (DUF2303 family)